MKIVRIIIPATGVFLFTACEKFVQDDPTAFTEEIVRHSYEYTIARANSIYADLPDGMLYIDGAMMAAASDEAEHTLETSAIQKFNTGAWNAFDNPDNRWGHYYTGIRKANQFLETADSVNLDIYRLNPDPSAQNDYRNRLAEINRCKYEIRFLRAFFYFELIKRYGGVPLITHTISLDDDSYYQIQRNTLAECVQFVADECDSAAAILPVQYPAEELGRATAVAALALKSRLLLYAASELFNTPSWAGSYAHPELISLPGDRQTRWKAAADAAKAVIDLNARTLSSSYPDLFGASNFNNQEVILARRNGQSNQFERASYPIGYDLGQSGTTPSQNLVDAYEMSDGTPFDWGNPAHATAPYENRDPRLTFSILTNNAPFKGRVIESWAGGRDGAGIEQSSRTGYYLSKYVNPNLDLLQNQAGVHSWVIFRLAEIYLNYAEALNEYDPGHPDIKYYVDRIRTRNGVDMPPLSAGLVQHAMRERIYHERQVEFAFEDHRFWDLRRWLQAPTYLGAPIRGVSIVKNGTEFIYTPIQVENRVFEPKMYLYPIPQSELLVTQGWSQNPIW